MKFRRAVCLVTIIIAALAITTFSQAQSATTKQAQNVRYKIIDLGTFGGPQSYVNIPDLSYARVLNNRGMVSGWADTPVPDPFPDFCFVEDCSVTHAFRWVNGAKEDLGVLEDGMSSDATWIAENGLIAGDSEGGEIDPLIPGFPEIHAVLWNGGQMIDLGTLEGGYESIATSANSHGQVVGLALNGIPDPDSIVGFGYQGRAFLWQNGVMQDLGTLGGPDAWAFVINERGQVAGNSYVNSEPSARCAQFEIGTLTTGAFLWDKGIMKDLGNFGGTCTFAFDLNNRGDVVGASSLAGDRVQHPFLWDGQALIDLHTFGGDAGTAIAINEIGDAVGWATDPDQVPHAALWDNGKIKDLGTLAGFPFSFGNDINARGQVVGFVSNDDFSEFRGFLWQAGGPMIDLNSLIPPGSDLRVVFPETINDQGEIVGRARLADGSERAFLMVPCGETQAGAANCDLLQDADAAIQNGRVGFQQAQQSNLRGNPALRLRPPSGIRSRIARFVLVPKS